MENFAVDADATLTKASEAYEQRWGGDERREIVAAVEKGGGIVSPKMESHSPLATEEWKTYRKAFHKLCVEMPDQFAKWIELGTLVAQVLALMDNEQPKILGLKFPIRALRKMLRILRDADPMFSDLDAELSNPRTNLLGYPNLDLVKRQVEAIRRRILDRLASDNSPGAEDAHGSGKVSNSAKPPTDQDTPSHSKPELTDEGGKQDPIEPEPSYDLIPPNQFSWKGEKPIELTPQQWKLLSYCLNNRRAEVQEVMDHVWGEDVASDKGESAIDSLKSKLNSRLAEAGIQIDLSRKAGYLILTIHD